MSSGSDEEEVFGLSDATLKAVTPLFTKPKAQGLSLKRLRPPTPADCSALTKAAARRRRLGKRPGSFSSSKVQSEFSSRSGKVKIVEPVIEKKRGVKKGTIRGLYYNFKQREKYSRAVFDRVASGEISENEGYNLDESVEYRKARSSPFVSGFPFQYSTPPADTSTTNFYYQINNQSASAKKVSAN